MNLAVYSHYFVPEIGAPSARIYDLARQWQTSGHQVQVVTCFPNHPTGTVYPGYQAGRYLHEQIDGIDVHRHWTYITPNKGFLKKTLGHISYLPSALWYSNPKLARPDVTIGTSPTFFAAMAAQRGARRHGVPFIMEVRDLWPAALVELGVLRQPQIIRWLERWELSLYRQAAKVVTVTAAFRQNLIDRGVPAAKVHNIPNGADENYWRPQPASPDLRTKLGLDGCFTVLYIGAHGISQALSRILDSAELLRDQPEIRFLFVGEGAEKEQLVQRARERKLANVQFHDPVDKEAVREFYALADVCLVPLRDIPLFQTFIPSKMFEMLAMERPVVASVCGEAAEILNASGGALVVPPEDSRAIAEAVRRLARDRVLGATLGRAGRSYVIDHYSRRALARKYLDVVAEAKAEADAASR